MKPEFKKIIFGIVTFGLLACLSATPVWAVQVKRVQSGTIYFDADDTLALVDLTNPVTDQSKTIVLVYARVPYSTVNRDQNYCIRRCLKITAPS